MSDQQYWPVLQNVLQNVKARIFGKIVILLDQRMSSSLMFLVQPTNHKLSSSETLGKILKANSCFHPLCHDINRIYRESLYHATKNRIAFIQASRHEKIYQVFSGCMCVTIVPYQNLTIYHSLIDLYWGRQGERENNRKLQPWMSI